jgi:hypothetical protein
VVLRCWIRRESVENFGTNTNLQQPTGAFPPVVKKEQHKNLPHNPSINQLNHPPAALCQSGIMGDDKKGCSRFLIYLIQQLENFIGSGGVKISGRLISENQRWICRKSASYGNPLLLPSGKFTRFEIHPVSQTDPPK